ncbi:uncharacterized protein LOC129619092 [Condylostylus longicornis]|uniref:uncharacterized protein LOC129619092 n=1 Tax=Condylostylus longicornis TaxID=2530218 RepID=UPI00244E03DD|nr:uncharacterized protein LOC129619092 [Condylostylus longicornis]
MRKVYSLVCAVLCIAVASAVSMPAIQSGTIDEVVLVESIEDFIKQNPDVTVTPMNKEIPAVKAKAFGQKAPIRYTMGRLSSSDRVLSNGQNSYYYPTLQDVKLQLSYPQSGVGGIVTYVEIIVEQSSGNGQAYIVAGRIGERFIRIVVEAKQTSYFIYRAAFYGY